jgi:uncharacterized MAPEG superfamily protein
MTTTLTLVIYMAIVTWVLIMLASMFRVKAYTGPGMLIAMSNRDKLPESSAFAGRATRTANNTAENFLLFAVIALVAHATGSVNPHIETGAEIFFWSRIIFIFVYYAGIAYLRTLVWAASVVGLGMMVAALL